MKLAFLFRSIGAALAIFSLAAAPVGAVAQTSAVKEFRVTSRPITNFRIGSQDKRFGPLEFVGGLVMSSGARDFGGISAFRFASPGEEFLAVTDVGMWVTGRIVRDVDGRPSGLSNPTLQPILGADGRLLDDKVDADAEGLTLRDGKATVSFERKHRVTEYPYRRGNMGAPSRNLDFVIPRGELRQNRGMETIVHAPNDGPLAGARMVVAEKSLDTNGNIFAAIIEGPQKGIFTVRRSGNFDITDGAFLPDGDLILLERKFSYSSGVAMRLRRIDGASIRQGALVDGPVLFEGGMEYQIDNMEGLDIWRRADGATMLSLVSDDNFSLLQRNLYLEFRLVE